MASSPARYRYRCQICGEPVGIWDEAEHCRAAHPEVLAVRQSQLRRYFLHYFPLIVLCLVVLGVALVLHEWWWRIGVLAGTYGLIAILLVFGVREWKVERPVLLKVVRSCPVCEVRMAASDLRRHLEGTHPDTWGLMRKSYWLIDPGMKVFLVYVLILLSLMLALPLPEWWWDMMPVLMIVPLFGWMVVVGIVGVMLNRTRLQPARKNWRMLHP